MDVDIDKAASKGHWDVKALRYVYVSPIILPRLDKMIERPTKVTTLVMSRRYSRTVIDFA
jgi:hypothetical protein